MEESLKEILFDPSVGKITTLVVGMMILWGLVKVLQKPLVRKIKDAENKYRTKKLANFLGWILTILFVTIVFSDKLGGLTVALGVAGAGIAFALQEVIASFAGWMAILFGGFYKTGDRIQLGGIRGDVIDIGVLRTTMMETGQWVDGDLYNGRIVRIANSFVFKEPVFNYSADFPFLWDEVKLPVQYGSNYKKAQAIIEESAEEIVGDYSKFAAESWKHMVDKYLIENASTKPMVTMIANDNWVEYTLRYVVDFKKRRITKNDLFSKMLASIESSDGEVKLASATFDLVGAPSLKVKIEP